MELTTFVMLAALPIMLVLGALALWLTQKPARIVTVNTAINDVVADNLNLPVTVIYLEPDGSLRGLAMQIQRLHGRRRSGDAMLTGFDAFDERQGRSTLFDFSRVLTMVDSATGDLVISPASFCADRAGISPRLSSPAGLKALAG